MSNHNLENNIQSIQDELSTKIEKTSFLAECALHKIQTRNLTYEKELDKYLEFLSINECNSRDLTRMTNTVLSLSSLVSKSYDNLITLIEKCDKNIFKNKD